jgi:hypothetical protein
MKFNINHDVKVKLNYSGRQELRRRHDELKRISPKVPDFKDRTSDDEGYTKFQMWDLMSTFGPLLELGTNPPFDTYILIDVPTDHNRENNMTERTINEAELKAILDSTFDITETIFTDITDAAFPPLFTPKEGEAIWVRDGEDERWVLRIFNRLFNGKYNCEADNLRKRFNWSQAKPQTPTERGEG